MNTQIQGLRIITDTREGTPFCFLGHEVIKQGLSTGDYSLEGFTDCIAIERKSLPDIVQCCGVSRDRFKAELLRLRSYKCKAVIIEATLKQIKAGNWRGKVTPEHVLGSIASWRNRYNIEFIYAGDHELAGEECLRLMLKYYDLCREYVRRFPL